MDTLSREIAAAMRTPDIQKVLDSEGVVPIGSTPAQFAEHIRKENERVARVVKASGAKFE